MTKADFTDPPRDLEFGELMEWFFRQGIRPKGTECSGRKWAPKEFADYVGVSGRQVRNWINQVNLPSNTETIERVLFGSSQKNYQQYRVALRESLERARDNRSQKSQYAKLSSVEMIWEFISEKANFEMIGDVDCNADNTRDLAWVISRADNRISEDEAKSIAVEARSQIFNEKYGNWKKEDDERHIGEGGIGLWNDEIIKIFSMLGITYDSCLLCVGIGCGLEGVGIYDQFREFYGIDISLDAVNRSRKKFSEADLFKGEAECLPGKVNGVDVYISLKTYSSSFFDINQAVSSCFHVLKPGGVAIISVPKGYHIDGKFIPGLARTNYDIISARQVGTYRIPDKIYPFELMQRIIIQLYRRMFCDIRIFTGIYEHYIFARKR